ncbi:large proline-rich protein BAG6 isoform X1 [Iris pallida]|uniref:Large proline-rich protein BAG6 isoform X1 n=1 Tax=Iris pallida TaxID=29817 RepID=A0AAX6GMY5_IRIPA|nr:large proline-rich protein BAG6 isoform X1 [Iris pallida]
MLQLFQLLHEGFPPTVIAAIPAHATSGTSGHVLSVAYPVHVSTQLSMPIHSASAQGSHPALSSGTRPNMTVPVPPSSFGTTTVPSLVEQINSQIASVLSRNAQGLNSTYNGLSTDTQGPCLMTTNSEVQNDMASVSSQTPFLRNSQIASGAQDQSSSSNLQFCDTSCTREGSQLVSPGLSSQLGDTNVYSQTQNEVGADDIGGSSSVKPLVSDASMHGIKGHQLEQESFCSATVDSRGSSDMRDGSITTSTELNAVCEPSDTLPNQSVSNALENNSSVEIIHASPSSRDSERDRPAPLGLGLGGLQPKKRLRHPKSVGKDQMPCEKPSTSQNQQSIARGQQFINSLVSQSSDADGVNANGSHNPLISVISQMKDSLPMGGGGGTGQVDASDMMSTILQSPVFNNILTGVSSQTGIGSSSDLRNMLDQVIRSPALKSTMNEIVQQVEGHSQDIGVGTGHGGLDFSRMIQQMMPAVSQALGRASTQPAAIPGFQPESHLLGDTIGRDGGLHEKKSKVDLLQAVERIEHRDAPVDIFRAVLDAASHLNGEGNDSDLSRELADNEELTNDFTSMLARDLDRRLKQDREE